MYADFLGNILDHHWLQFVDTAFEELELTADDGLTNFQDGLLTLLNIFHQLQRGSVFFLDVVPDFLAGLLIAVEHPAILGIHPQLREVIVVELDNVAVRILCDVDVWFDGTSALSGVADSWSRVQMTDHVDGDLDVLQRA